MLRKQTPARRASDPDYMLSLARGLQVIRAFGRERPVLTIAEVARLTSMSRAAARRCLHTLGVLGYVAGDGGRYALAPRVLALGHAYLGSAPVAQAAQPVLERVAERLHESCSLAVLDADEIVYVARAATRRIMAVGLAVGSRLPAYCTSMGRVLLAFASDAERSAYLRRVKPVRHTPHTTVGRRALAAELSRVRSAGYAIVDQELELGLRSMAVPVRRPDQAVVAAMNVGVHAARVESETLRREYLPVLLEAAEEVGLALAHRLS
ncbi:MAG TPA: IclR family transcriptional regulator C-terminal domain-containing protein [Vicinamibacteria bacterium]|jgi:IclR family pca regulon transcriptional regulator